VEADRRRRRSSQNRATRRAERARRSKEIGQLPPEERKAAGASVRALAEEIAVAEAAVERAEDEFRARMLELPNLPHPAVPVGPDASGNRGGRTGGELRPPHLHCRAVARCPCEGGSGAARPAAAPPRYDFEPRPHWDLGPALGAIDFE